MVLRSNQYEIFSLALNLAVINCEDSSNVDETDRIGRTKVLDRSP